MKKQLLIATCVFMLGAYNQVNAQSSSQELTPAQKREMTTPLKPADGQAYVFSSKEDLEAGKAKKADALREEILRNLENPEKVKALRENLWRIENAVVRH